MIVLCHDGSFWLKTGTPHGVGGLGDGVAARAELAAPVSGEGPGGPCADSTPCSSPIWPAAVKQSEAECPWANTSSGRSVTLCGGMEPSLRTVHTSNPAARNADSGRPTTYASVSALGDHAGRTGASPLVSWTSGCTVPGLATSTYWMRAPSISSLSAVT